MTIRKILAIAVVAVSALAVAAPALAVTGRAPTLTYAQAKKAASGYAVRFAAKDAVAPITLRTQPAVGTLMRMSRLSYYAQTSWTKTNPAGCHECGYNETTGTFYDTPTEISCSLNVMVVRSAKRPFGTRVVIRDSSCI